MDRRGHRHRPQSLEEKRLRERMEIQEKVKARFARFGDRLCLFLTQEALKPKGVRTLLRELNLPPGNDLDDQLDTLAGHVSRKGSDRLLRQLGRKPASGETDSPEEAGERISESPPPLFDEQGRYQGPERRSGRDRRTGKDRRGSIEAIRKNKRYGRDRRQTVRRRQDRGNKSGK